MSSSDDIDYNIICECGDEFSNEELLKVHLKLNNNHINEIKEEFDKVKNKKEKNSDNEDNVSRQPGYNDQKGTWKHENLTRFIEIDATSCQRVIDKEDSRCILNKVKTEYDTQEEPSYVEIELDVLQQNHSGIKTEAKKKELKHNVKGVEPKKKYPTPPKNHSCTTCGKCFASAKALQTHTYTHTGERPFVCTVCDKAFMQKCNLKTHIRVHTGDRPFACDLCPKRFANSYAVIRHKRIHTGEKPYVCEECGRSFAQSTSKIFHYNSAHLGLYWPNYKKKSRVTKIKCATVSDRDERPFPCSDCNKAFTHKATLSKHLKVHTKPYACNQSNAIKAHVMTAHLIEATPELKRDIPERLPDLRSNAMQTHLLTAHLIGAAPKVPGQLTDVRSNARKTHLVTAHLIESKPKLTSDVQKQLPDASFNIMKTHVMTALRANLNEATSEPSSEIIPEQLPDLRSNVMKTHVVTAHLSEPTSNLISDVPERLLNVRSNTMNTHVVTQPLIEATFNVTGDVPKQLSDISSNAMKTHAVTAHFIEATPELTSDGPEQQPDVGSNIMKTHLVAAHLIETMPITNDVPEQLSDVCLLQLTSR